MFSPDGSKVLTASADKSAKLWDAATGKELAAFHHDSGVYSAVFSPDGSKALTASADGTAKLWDAVTAQSLAAFLRGAERSASNEDRDSASRSILHQIELLSEYASEREITEDGSLISSSRTLQLRNQLMNSAKDDHPMSRLIRWLCSPSEETTILPSSSVSAAIWVDNQIITIPQVTKAFATEAFEALPDSPLPEIAMAQFVKDSAGAKFLRSQALQRLPKDSQICTRAGELLRDQGQPTEALMAADKALAADTSSLPAHRLRAGCLADLNRWEAAIQEYKMILERPDAGNDDFCLAGYLAARMGKDELCDSVFSRGIDRFPRDANLYYFRGWSLLNLHRAADAVTAFEIAENSLGGGQPSTWLLAGEAAANWAAGAKDKGVAAYVRLINIDKQWAGSSFVADLDLTDAEKQPLLETLAETLRIKSSPGSGSFK